MAYKADFSAQYKDPRWQMRRLQVMERAGFCCEHCGSKEKTLHIHHTHYSGKVWETADMFLRCFCEDCHEEWHNRVDSIKSEIAFFTLKELCLLSDFSEKLGEK